MTNYIHRDTDVYWVVAHPKYGTDAAIWSYASEEQALFDWKFLCEHLQGFLKWCRDNGHCAESVLEDTELLWDFWSTRYEYFYRGDLTKIKDAAGSSPECAEIVRQATQASWKFEVCVSVDKVWAVDGLEATPDRIREDIEEGFLGSLAEREYTLEVKELS